MNFSVSTAEQAMVRGFVVFGIVALCGARLLFRGIKKDIVDATSVPNGSRWSWVVGGIVLQIHLIGYTSLRTGRAFSDPDRDPLVEYPEGMTFWCSSRRRMYRASIAGFAYGLIGERLIDDGGFGAEGFTRGE